MGHLAECGCDDRIRSKDTKGKWEWGGCSDDIRFGASFSKDFVDSGEDLATPHGLVNLHNNEAGRRVSVLRSRDALDSIVMVMLGTALEHGARLQMPRSFRIMYDQSLLAQDETVPGDRRRAGEKV